jgi:hypothetical protein
MMETWLRGRRLSGGPRGGDVEGKILSIAATGVVAAVMAIGGCAHNASGPAPTTSPTQAPPAQTASPTARAGPLPAYPGAEVTRHLGGTTLLHTDDPVGKVGTFYADTLAKEGWRTVSRYLGDRSADIVAKKGHEGVTVQVSPTGSGTSISITSYPTG